MKKSTVSCPQCNKAIVWDTTKPDGQPRRGLDISRAKSLLGWTPKQDFDAGLKTTVEWWRAHGRS